jgi:hypothetical protein
MNQLSHSNNELYVDITPPPKHNPYIQTHSDSLEKKRSRKIPIMNDRQARTPIKMFPSCNTLSRAKYNNITKQRGLSPDTIIELQSLVHFNLTFT